MLIKILSYEVIIEKIYPIDHFILVLRVERRVKFHFLSSKRGFAIEMLIPFRGLSFLAQKKPLSCLSLHRPHLISIQSESMASLLLIKVPRQN